MKKNLLYFLIQYEYTDPRHFPTEPDLDHDLDTFTIFLYPDPI